MMTGHSDFDLFLDRVRTGDERAAEDLVHRYEQAVRVAVRVRLTDPALRRQFDSTDVCQQVLASFFVRAAAGQYDLASPAQLVALLVEMATRKVKEKIRFHTRQRRDVHRADPASFNGVVSPAIGPERIVIGRDLLAALRARLTEDERAIMECRASGQTWAEVAEAVGGHPQALRRQFIQTLDRVASDLGIEDAP